MTEVLLFAEDFGHEKFAAPLIRRIAAECGNDVHVDIRSSVGGRPRLMTELRRFVEDCLAHGAAGELVVVVTDANCFGRPKWCEQINKILAPLLTEQTFHIVIVTPDPHVERWMLVDGHAFKEVFGRGCNAPDEKCEKERYKQMLLGQIAEAGVDPLFGGMEYAPEIVQNLNLEKALTGDASLGIAIRDLRRALCPPV